MNGFTRSSISGSTAALLHAEANAIYVTQTIIKVASIAELHTAYSTAVAGDVIELADGIYADAINLTGSNGIENSTITIRSATIGGVILNSTLTMDSNWITIQGFKFNDSAGSVNVTINAGTTGNRLTLCTWDGATGTRWIQSGTSGSSNSGTSAKRIEIDYCNFLNRGNLGTGEHQLIQLWVSAAVSGNVNHTNVYEGHHIHHNLFKDSTAQAEGYEILQLISYQPAGHYTIGVDTEILIENNFFNNADGESECVSVKCCGVTVKNNTFNNTGGNLTLRYGKRHKVIGNYFFNTNGGINVADEGHYIYNNTFKNLSGHGIGFYHADDTSFVNAYAEVNNCSILFNTFVDCRYSINNDLVGSLKAPDTAPSNTIVANNAFIVGTGIQTIREGTQASTGTVYEGNKYLGTLGINSVTGMTAQDPNLTLNADGTYRPIALGNADGTALGSYPDVTIDAFGTTRGTPKDIGAIEVGSTSSTVLT